MDHTSFYHNFHDTSYSHQNNHMYTQPNSNVLYQNYNERPGYGQFYSPQSSGYQYGSFNGQNLSNSSKHQEHLNGIHSFNHSQPSPTVSN